MSHHSSTQDEKGLKPQPSVGPSLAEEDSSFLGKRQPGVAHVRVAVALENDELQRLQRALEDYFGHSVQIQTELDSSILGGVWVRVRDTVIDGSLRGQLEALRHHLLAQSQIMIAAKTPSTEPESET